MFFFISLQLTADVPRFPPDEREEISRSMHDSQNENLVVLNETDDAVLFEEHFSEVWAAELGNDSTDPGCLEQGLGRFNSTINECDREAGLSAARGSVRPPCSSIKTNEIDSTDQMNQAFATNGTLHFLVAHISQCSG
ncbi:MAG: hypothetical protein Q7U39_08270 [Nitrospira sp.]|nr:hypothetical protein [Nitrospira sp.]